MHIVNRKIKVLRGYVRLLPRGMMMHHKQETLPLQSSFSNAESICSTHLCSHLYITFCTTLHSIWQVGSLAVCFVD